jgi:hypothetical protein
VATLSLKDSLWTDLLALARRRKKQPAALAEEAVREFLRRMNDEELLERSGQTARKTRLKPSRAEELIRQHRRKAKG